MAPTPFRLARSRCTVLSHLSQLLFADYVVDNALLYPWLGGTTNYTLLRLSFFAISALAILSHARTMLTDPGAVPMGYQPNTLVRARRPCVPTLCARRRARSAYSCVLVRCRASRWQLANEAGNKMSMCSRCDGFKPPRAHHCSQCNRCIIKMDHHCPWVNNCVGANNQKHFVLFTFYTATLSAYAIVLLMARSIYSTHGLTDPNAYRPPVGHRHGHRNESGERFLLLTLLFFEALLFGLFTLAMCTEQLSSIISDMTGIERLKHDHISNNRSWIHNLSETFGRPASLLWLLPTTVKYNGLTWLDLLPQECEV